MATTDTGDEPYHPSYLLFNEFFVDPTAATFFSNQSTSAGPISNLPVATAYNTLNNGNFAEQSSKPSSLTSIRKEPTGALFSAPTFSGNSTASSVASLSSNLVKGNTICASRCAPHSDIQFRPVGRPTHLGTVAAQRCAPKSTATFSRSFEQRTDTVIATPMLKQSAKLLSRPQQYPHVYAPPAGPLRHAPPPEDTVYSSPSYDSQLDLGYSSNYSLRDHHSSYQLPDVTKPSPGNRVAHHYPSSGYKCAGFGAHLNALNSTSNVKDGLSRKRCRDNGTAVRRSKSEKSPQPMKRKYTKKKSASTEETKPAHGASQHPKASKSYTSTMFHANRELNAVASGVSTTKQEVYCGRNIIAFEKGQFLIRIGDIRNLDHADDVIWFVQSYDRLQKYILKDMDCHANREYARSDSVSPFVSNELWRYYPLNATTLRINEEQELVIVSHFPSNEEIVRYQTNNMVEKPSARINVEPANFNMFQTGGNVMAAPNRQFMNDTGIELHNLEEMQLLVARFRCRHPVCATKPPAENDHSISTVYEHVGQHLMFDTRSNDHMNLVCSCSENFCFMGAPHAVHHLYNVRQDPQQHHRVQCRRISLADIDNSTNMRAYLKRFVAFGGYRQEEDHSHHLHVHPMLGTEEMQRSYSQHGLPPMSGRMVDRQPGSTWQFAHRPGEDAPIMDSDREMLGHYGHHNNMTPPPVIGSSIGFHQAAPTFYGQNATAPYFTGWSYGSSATSVNGFAPAPPMAAAHSVASQMYFAPGNNPQMPGGNRAPSPNVRSPVYNKRLLSPLPLIISDATNREAEVNYGHRTPFPANSRGNHARRCAAGWSERIGAGRDVVERIDQDDDPATDFVPGWLRNSAGNLTRKQTVNESLTFPRKGKNGPRSRMQAAPYTRFREHDSQRRSGLTRRRLFAFEDVIMADTSLLRQDRSQESFPKKNIKNEISDRSSD